MALPLATGSCMRLHVAAVAVHRGDEPRRVATHRTSLKSGAPPFPIMPNMHMFDVVSQKRCRSSMGASCQEAALQAGVLRHGVVPARRLFVEDVARVR